MLRYGSTLREAGSVHKDGTLWITLETGQYVSSVDQQGNMALEPVSLVGGQPAASAGKHGPDRGVTGYGLDALETPRDGVYEVRKFLRASDSWELVYWVAPVKNMDSGHVD